ncbi:Hsp70 family protein [Acanthopleuribacter pedis]|uniref:Hsp70 family protein n=1 Tax=Acanthopleuribacter pedis TaxID=442870 RepID=A0A8J7U615_9BACT|nr:Hsp70 family protein [Acanthopleuribacter pedis]MBO1321419.1 Hsp70 family protein [Acanthopleuribacter pedis]
MQKGICAIDFGTSNTVMAYVNNGEVALARLEQNNNVIPSTVFYGVEGETAFGREAIELFKEGEEGRFMRSLKRILGTRLMGQGTSVNGRQKKYEAIIADFLRNTKKGVERTMGTEFDRVVMGRPVFFQDNDEETDQRAQDELERIAKSIGFKEVSFQFEPIAASFAHEQELQKEALALVVDIGGGTSDFTVMRLSKEKSKQMDRRGDVLANTGTRIGGNDFDKTFCLSSFMQNFGFGQTYGDKNLPLPNLLFYTMSEWSEIHTLYNRQVMEQAKGFQREVKQKEPFGRFVELLEEESGHKVLDHVEQAKIALSDVAQTDVLFDFLSHPFEAAVTREELNNRVTEHVDKIITCSQKCVATAGITPADLDLIILTGGTTENPYLRRRVIETYPNATLSENGKLASVATGLGFDAMRRYA